MTQRFQPPPPWVQLNLLEQLTELRQIFYLLDYQFLIRGYNSRTDGRDA